MNVLNGSIRRRLTVVVFCAALLALPSLALAVDNVGTGDVAGDLSALDPSNTFVLNPTTLALVKRAFDLSDNPIPSGSTIPVGAQFKFLVYINNTSPVAVSDVSIQDALAVGFGYQADSIKVDNSVGECAVLICTPAEELNIFQTTDGTAALTDTVNGDGASFAGTTVDVGDENVVGNGTVSIAADSVLAVVFTVTMQ